MARILLILAALFSSTALTFAQGSSIASATPIAPAGTSGGSMDNASTKHYWKVTTTADGYLMVQVNSSSTIDADLTLYDTDGSYTIMNDGQTGTYSEVFAFLKPGTYYLYVWRWQGVAGTYTITTSFATPLRPTDQTEPNDSPSGAMTLAPNGTANGHLGYFGSGAYDTQDYWKITTSEDGWLRVQVRSDSLDQRGGAGSVYDLDLTLYDINGTSSLSNDGRTGTFSQVSAFLRPGTYYVRVNRWQGRGASYEIKSDLLTTSYANDGESNNTSQTATPAVLNGTTNGHVGYMTNGTTDTEDYWKITTTADGRVSIQVTTDSLDRSGAAFDCDLTIYDVNGLSSIAQDLRTGRSSECVLYLRPGTFFIRVNRWMGGGGGYQLKIVYSMPPLTNDLEGNDWFSSATYLTHNVTSTGHLGYQANGFVDARDYWKLVAPAHDSIYVHVFSDSTIDLDLTAYSPDSLGLASDGRYGIYSQVGIKATLGQTYYFKVNRWTGSAGSYTILATRSSVAVSIGQAREGATLPSVLTLEQNFPNPFNPSTTIRYGLPERQQVKITVFTLLGQQIADLVNTMQSPGSYSVVWGGQDRHGADMPSGVYLIRLHAGNNQIVKKAMMVR